MRRDELRRLTDPLTRPDGQTILERNALYNELVDVECALREEIDMELSRGRKIMGIRYS